MAILRRKKRRSNGREEKMLCLCFRKFQAFISFRSFRYNCIWDLRKILSWSLFSYLRSQLSSVLAAFIRVSIRFRSLLDSSEPKKSFSLTNIPITMGKDIPHCHWPSLVLAVALTTFKPWTIKRRQDLFQEIYGIVLDKNQWMLRKHKKRQPQIPTLNMHCLSWYLWLIILPGIHTDV